MQHRDGNGIAYAQNSNVYTRLNDYCGLTNESLGVGCVAPDYQTYNVNQAVQKVPVFDMVNYMQAPYQNNLMYNAINRDGTPNCDCDNGYCKANTAYKWPTDKKGNPLPEAVYNKNGGVISGYSPMTMVNRGLNQMVNQDCASNPACKTQQYGVAVNMK